MDDDILEICDDEINLEEIMHKIRENIRGRQVAAELHSCLDSIIASPSKNFEMCELNDTNNRDFSYINSNWDIHNNCYFISSHHPHIGKFLVKGRQIVHGEVRRYVDPMISSQTEFNASTVRIINLIVHQNAELNQCQQDLETVFSSFQLESDKKIADSITTLKGELDSEIELTTQELTTIKGELDSEIELTTQELTTIKGELDSKIELTTQELTTIKGELDSKIELTTQELTTIKGELDSKIELTTQELTTIKGELDSKIELTTQELTTIKSEMDLKIGLEIKEFVNRMDDDIKAKAWLVHLLEDRVQKGLGQKIISPASISEDNINYYLFEEQFRGSREVIKQRQLTFLPYYDKCSRVLDIGCGRGEFLEILKDHEIGGIGVDSDPDMVAYCRSRHLNVEKSDAVAYLETLEDKSLDGIFIDQVIEHLEPDYLIRLLELCYQKMKYGYYIVIETVNPLSFVSFANFYIDMTHKRPVHPETLQYLFSASGFRESEKKFFSPVSDEGRLKQIEGTGDMNGTDRKNVETYNHNIAMLNSVLFGAQDYAVIGKK
jgi:SAM-dependent methyltransferase